MLIKPTITAAEAKQKLIDGNTKYMNARFCDGDISPEIRLATAENGQHPYAVIVACSDSRVIPEAIFNTGIGELFVIRVAGNVIDNHQLGSIEYAADHLGTPLIVVLGHDRCGAVDAAMNHSPDGYIKYITDEVLRAIGDEQNEFKACCLNAQHAADMIEENIDIQKMEHDDGLEVHAAIYHISTGEVEFL